MHPHSLHALTLPLAFATVLLGCDASTAQDPPAHDRFEVQVSGGVPPHWDGVHTLTGDMACHSTGGHPSGNIWGATFELPSVHSGHTLKSVLVMLIGVPASGGQTGAVDFWMQFGELDHDEGNLIGVGDSMGQGAGSGTGTVERRGRGAVIRIEGTSNQGHQLSAVVECATVAVVR